MNYSKKWQKHIMIIILTSLIKLKTLIKEKIKLKLIKFIVIQFKQKNKCFLFNHTSFKNNSPKNNTLRI